MSAVLKRAPEPTPTPFPSAERAALAHAIAAAADAGARRVALEQASQSANADVLAAIHAVEAAEVVLAEAGPLAIKHVVDKAVGTAGPPPMSVAQARAAVIRAQDYLEECRATRAALKTELDASANRWSALSVEDAAKAVIRSEMQQRAIALAARVAEMQRQLVMSGSALEWLHRAGVFGGEAADVRHTVEKLDVAPNQWATGTIRYAMSVFEPTGRLKWEAAFERLKTDATAALPED
jgi:hypothetical protein